ncbi:PssE/Cps14G family polysaccharide biosynthesis glycosyltransferase [Limosilactobacillus reuteri]|uniref:PssE/Cps14G family polysaccharide biosynthesis glycosyltransferase n=1 Tax=Limosilactobacillus reuteri TaxID=1598 RepID=UPI003D7846BE
MIFVTVGTHEQQFNRLLKKVDQLVGSGVIQEKVIMQTGFSTYQPKHCKFSKMVSFDEMNSYISKAHIVITHGGPSSFVEVLQHGKVPIVVPRLKKYEEHINNHQEDFVKLIQKKNNNIIPVYNINDLEDAIRNYDDMNLESKIKSNNENFNRSFSKIVDKLFENKSKR